MYDLPAGSGEDKGKVVAHSLGVTGHQYLEHFQAVIQDWTRERLTLAHASGFTDLVSGMAEGFDIIAAEIALDVGFKVHGAIPFRNQVLGYSDYWMERYMKVYDRCTSWTIIGGVEKSPGCYQRRNRWIVDKTSKLVAYYSGTPRGGTHHTVTYAQSLGRPIEYFPYRTKGGA